MARPRKALIEEMNKAIVETVTTPPPNLETEETEETEGREVYELTASERIAEIKARGEIKDVVSRIYALTNKGREFIGKYEDVAEEDYLAEKYGSGKYMVFYIYPDKDGKRVQTSENFNISELYRGARDNVPARADRAPAGGFLGGFLENMTAEKVAGVVAAIQGLKAIFAPPPPPVDMTELIKALAAPKQNVGDAVLIKAMEMTRPAAPAPVAAPSMLQQIKDIQAVKELLNDSASSAGGNDTMDMIINAGLKMLPAILAQHGGNYQQAGAAVRENPLISGMVEKDPELLGEFCAAVRDKYGAQAARDLAAGYGFTFDEETPAETPQIETTTEQAAATAAGA
jgi:hypothetical protein